LRVPLEEEEKKQIIAAYLAGESTRAIYSKFNRSEQTIRQVVREAGLWRRPPKPRPEVNFTIQLGEDVLKLLKEAADQRDLSASQLAAQIITGVVTKGAKLDRACEMATDYENEREKRANAEATEMSRV
jgi:transposase